MSYYDPKYYNYDRLHDEDKRLMDYYKYAVRDALNRDFIIDDMLGLDHDEEERPILDKIKAEIANEVFDAIEEYLETTEMENYVSIIDGYGESD